MIQRNLRIGRWWVEFYFCPDGYDIDYLMDRLWTLGSPAYYIGQALDLMEKGGPDKGYTFSNPLEKTAMVVIGPTTSGAEFQDSLVHELQHLAVAIASELGINLKGEGPAYLAGDTMRDLAHIVCELGCEHCHG